MFKKKDTARRSIENYQKATSFARTLGVPSGERFLRTSSTRGMCDAKTANADPSQVKLLEEGVSTRTFDG